MTGGPDPATLPATTTWDRRRPVVLDDPDAGWIVTAGAVDIHVVHPVAGAPGRRRYLCSVPEGCGIFGGLGRRTDGAILLAVPTGATRVTRCGRAEVLQAATPGRDVAALVAGWITRIVDALLELEAYERERGSAPARPGPQLTIDPDDATLVPGHTASLPPSAGVCWVVPDGVVEVTRPDLGKLGSGLPLTPRAVLTAPATTRLRLTPAARALRDPEAWRGITALLSAAVDIHTALVATWDAQDAELMVSRAELERRRHQASIATLAQAGLGWHRAATPPLDASEPPVLWACRRVGESLGAAVDPPPSAAALPPTGHSVRAIAHASRLRYRAVTLEPGWWRGESGPLVAFRQADGAPVALIETGRGGYLALEPGRPSRPVDAAMAAAFFDLAYTVYRHVPEDLSGLRSLVRFGLRGTAPEWRRIVGLALATGLVGLAVPVATSSIVSSVIPTADRQLLFSIVGALVLAALASGLLTVVRNVSVGRLVARFSNPLEIAVWDRLLALPTRFFKRFSAGDLVTRATGVDVLRQSLSGGAVQGVVTGVSSLFAVGLMLYYDVALTVLAALSAVTVVAVTLGLLNRQSRLARELNARQAETNGLMVQLLDGATKLRVAGAEERGFGVWAAAYGKQRAATNRVSQAQNALTVLTSAVPNAALLVLFLTVAALGAAAVQPAPFLGAQSAFSQLMTGVVGAATAMGTLVAARPVFEQLGSIFAERPEREPSRADPGALSGRTEINEVVFRYTPDGPAVLDGLSLDIAPGEFVALVGESGCGKSTLLRLLLGFERPESGSIFYDHQDLETLDVEAVRRQIGTVLQDGAIMPGTVLTNIVGNTGLGSDEAWAAAERAGLADDIRAMPMGMHTPAGSGAQFSGGQRQRMLIARALTLDPKILILDEATSALDNATQKVVSDSLAALGVTRIVVAHRLTTIVDADRIVVLAGGRIVQQGTYAELIAVDGPFRDLANRQLA